MAGSGPKLGAHGRQRVLVVDPDRSAGAEIGEVLQDMGYAVEVARDGFEALSALSRSPPVLLVVDQALDAKLDAAALVARVRKLRDVKDVAVVVTAARASAAGVQDRLRDSGVKVFVEKPVSSLRLGAAIRAAMGKEPAVTQPAAGSPLVRPPPRPRGPGNTVPSARAPTPSRRQAITSPIGSASVSTGSMLSVAGLSEVDCWLEWDTRRQGCVLEQVSMDRAVIRCADSVPAVGGEVRLTVPLRTVVQDAMKDVPVRILGAVQSCQPAPGGARLEIEIKAAQPEGNFRKLRNYLARDRG